MSTAKNQGEERGEVAAADESVSLTRIVAAAASNDMATDHATQNAGHPPATAAGEPPMSPFLPSRALPATT